MEYGDKIVVWTDLHLGLRNNEQLHNKECKEFVKWMIKEAKEFGAEKSIFCGDFHHYRSSVQCNTLNHSVAIFKLLSKAFKQHYQIVGNHDLFYKNKRDVNSVEFCRDMPNITLVDKLVTEGVVSMAPWLVAKKEFNDLVQTKSPYIFAHLELPDFYMNSFVKMPDNGENNPNCFTENQHIFSGHFHKRQSKENNSGAKITYLGNCFPHDFSDAWDDNRGIMLLELGKEPVYKAWPNAPKYKTLTLSELMENPAEHVDNKTKLKVIIDSNIGHSDLNFIRESLYKEFKPRELSFLPYEETHKLNQEDENLKFVSVDQIIIEHLTNIESVVFDNSFLIDLYKNI